MSGGTSCRCDERDRPLSARRWMVTQRRCNHSAFSGYRTTPSDYSAVVCEACNASWRTSAKYVQQLPDWTRAL